MATSKAGQELSEDEVTEVIAYTNAKITLPEKYDGLVKENIAGIEVYRYPTDAEVRRVKDEAAATAESAAADQKMLERITGEAKKRGIEPPPPPPPAPEGSGPAPAAPVR